MRNVYYNKICKHELFKTSMKTNENSTLMDFFASNFSIKEIIDTLIKK